MLNPSATNIIRSNWPHSHYNNESLYNYLVKSNTEDIYNHLYMFFTLLKDHIDLIEKFDFPILDYIGFNADKFWNSVKGE